jgi:DNA (cytosine-5)-methyltransferase 1
LGRKRGGLDPRGVVPLYGLQWIIKEQPKACILENVAGLLHKKHADYVAFLREILTKMNYVLFKKKMTTLGYGIPQSWCRVYIVAIRADAKKEKFKWPKEIKFSKSWLIFFWRPARGVKKK